MIVLLLCGINEVILRSTGRTGNTGSTGNTSRTGRTGRARRDRTNAIPFFTAAASTSVATGSWAALTWTAFKVGALAYGGGFVIIPLMHADAVDHHWMTNTQFLNAVALGQITPGPVTQTVAAVGYAAAGLAGGLLAATVAFAPSFVFILVGGERFDRLRAHPSAQTFLQGAGPAAIGAILGSAIPLARSLAEPWQFGVLAAAALALFVLRRGTVSTLLGAAVIGAVVAVAGGAVPR